MNSSIITRLFCKFSLSFFCLICLFAPQQGFSQILEEAELLFNWTDSSLPGSSAYNNTYNEIWGLAVNGREFAVIGSTAGTHIFDVTQPDLAHEVAFIEGAATGPQIIHRDYHDYSGYLYIVCDEVSSQSTLQIVDISNLPESAEVVYDSNDLIRTSHNIFIDTTSALLYACAVQTNNNDYESLILYSLQNPENPTEIGPIDLPDVTHDIYVRNDTAYLNLSYTGFSIMDFSDPSNPLLLGAVTDYSYFGQGYNHSGWLTNDGKYYVFADEDHGLDVKIANVENLSDIYIASSLNSGVASNSIAHNIIIKDDYLFISYYHDGLQVFDISNPFFPTKISSYNTYLPNDHSSYRGAWGVYPNLPSGNVLVSDMQYGLFVLDVGMEEATQISGITDPISSENKLKVIFDSGSNSIKANWANAKTGKSKLSVFDMTGRLINHQNQEVIEGQNLVQLMLNEKLATGQYIFQIKQGQNTLNKTFQIH